MLAGVKTVANPRIRFWKRDVHQNPHPPLGRGTRRSESKSQNVPRERPRVKISGLPGAEPLHDAEQETQDEDHGDPIPDTFE